MFGIRHSFPYRHYVYLSASSACIDYYDCNIKWFLNLCHVPVLCRPHAIIEMLHAYAYYISGQRRRDRLLKYPNLNILMCQVAFLKPHFTCHGNIGCFAGVLLSSGVVPRLACPSPASHFRTAGFPGSPASDRTVQRFRSKRGIDPSVKTCVSIKLSNTQQQSVTEKINH